MAEFIVHGPFEVKYQKRPGGRILIYKDFWSDKSPAYFLADECGCYVFAAKTGRGCIPIYIGQATKTFEQEVFTERNQNKYSRGFSEYQRCKPVMFFVEHPKQRGKTNAKQIDQIENFLIQSGYDRNPEIQNKQGKYRPKWSIRRVVGGGIGKRNAAENAFRELFGLKK